MPHEPLRPVAGAHVPQVRVAGQQIPVDDAVMTPVHTIAPFHAVGKPELAFQGLQSGIMELMAIDPAILGAAGPWVVRSASPSRKWTDTDT